MSECLTTRRLRLRPFRPSDAPRLAELGGDRAIADTMISVPHPFGLEQAIDWITEHTKLHANQLAFAICQRTDDQLVGSFSIVDINVEHAIGELSFWVGRPFWGQGIASEAGGAVIEEAFSTRQLNRLQAHHMVRNPASAHVLSRWGFQPEGLLRQRVQKWGVFEDVVICGLLRDDWPTRKNMIQQAPQAIKRVEHPPPQAGRRTVVEPDRQSLE